MCWNYEELRELYKKKGLQDSRVYQNSLRWKLGRADYHAERAQKVWSELDQIAKAKKGVQFQEWEETRFTSTAETEAAAQALHSMADILAQIINIVVLKPSLPENAVSLESVYEKLNKNGSYKEKAIVSKIEALKDSKEFKYLHAFVNTIKHRRLLDTDYEGEIWFKAFTYKRRNYPAIRASDILGDYKKKIVDLICTVGNAVNDYLRKFE